MSLPGHRRTSSHKRRRASHFALVAPALTVDKTGRFHLSHKAAPGATEYRGIKIHIKGADRKMKRLLEKASPKSAKHDHEHDHGHDHNHAEEKATEAVKA